MSSKVIVQYQGSPKPEDNSMVAPPDTAPGLDEMTLRAMMRSEEGSVEFKESLPCANDIAEYCAGIGNSGGGWLIAGITDKKPRSVKGVSEPPPRDLEALQSSVFDAANMRVIAQVLKVAEGCVIALKIPARRRGHVFWTKRGKYLTRSGSSLRGMTPDEIASIFAETAPAGDDIQKRVEDVELSIELRTGHPQWSIVYVENQSAEDVTIEEVVLKKSEVELAPPARVNCLLKPDRTIPLGWRPDKDPVTALDLLVPPEPYAGVPPPFVTTIDVIIGCRILDRKKSFTKTMLVEVDVMNRRIRQI